MRQARKFSVILANTALALALVMPASAQAFGAGLPLVSPVAAGAASASSVRAEMTDMVPLAGTQVSYDGDMDVQVFEGVYTNDHPEQVEDIRLRVRKYAHPSGELIDDTYVPVTNDYIVGVGGQGTYRIELPMSSTVMWDVTGPYAVHGMSLPKRLSAVVTSSSVDVSGARHYYGTVTNDSSVNVPLTDIIVSGQEKVAGSFFGQASDVARSKSGTTLAPQASTSFELIGARPTEGATPVLEGVKAEGRFQTVLGVSASTLAPAYGSSVKLTGSLRGGLPLSVVPSATVSFLGSPVVSGVGSTKSVVSWNGSSYLASVKPVHGTSYRVRFDGDSNFAAAVSTEIVVKPKVSLTTPTAPTIARKGRAFTSVGYLKPYHSGYTKIRAFRYERGKWVLRKTVSAKNAKYNSYAKFAIAISLPSTGKWRLQAYRATDTAHTLSISSYRNVTVK